MEIKRSRISARPRSKYHDNDTSGVTIINNGSGSGGSSGGGSADFDIKEGEGISIVKSELGKLSYKISHGLTSEVEDTKNENGLFVSNLYFDAFGHVKSVESSKVTDVMDGFYLRKDIDDTAFGVITFESAIKSGLYDPGFKGEGWLLQSDGEVWLKELNLRGDALLNGVTRSALFASGFDGSGWSIENEGVSWLKDINLRGDLWGSGKIGTPTFASGFTGWGLEMSLGNASLELDYLTVRKSMRVYELVVNQLRGSNGNLVVTDFNKLEKVEEVGSAWRCYIDDYDGEMYQNMRVNDIVRCQVFDGNNVKYYLAKVTSVGNDWFEISKTMLEGSDVPAPGDVVCRWNNYTDTNRQGLIYLTSSDSYSPYIDILDGGPEVGGFERIRARIGRLEGITDPRFPEMKKYGIWTDSFYGYGDLVINSTGELVSSSLKVLDNRITAEVREVISMIPDRADNILKNSDFDTDLSYWDYESKGINSYLSGVDLLFTGSSLFSYRYKETGIVYDEGAFRKVLKISSNTVTQKEEFFGDREPDSTKYEIVFSYKVTEPGTLKIGVSGTDFYHEEAFSETTGWKSHGFMQNWDGKGNFEISFSGEILIYNVSVIRSDKAYLIDMIEGLRTEMAAGLELTAEQAKLYAEQQTLNSYNKITQEYKAAISVSANNINLSISSFKTEFNNFKTETDTAINLLEGEISLKVSQTDFNALGDRVRLAESAIVQNADEIQLRVTEIESLGKRVTKAESSITQHATQIEAKVSSEVFNQFQTLVTKNYATTTWTAEQISNYVLKENYNGATVASLINQTADGVKIQANKVEITIGGGNSVLDSENLETTSMHLNYSERQNYTNIESPFGGMRDFITYAVNSNGTYHLRFYRVINKNGTYTFSAYIRPYRNCSLLMDVAENAGAAIPLTAWMWKRCYITVNVQNYNATYNFADLRFLESNGNPISSQIRFNIAFVQVEESNVLTNWNRHPDEANKNISSAIENFKTSLGALAYKDLIEAAQLGTTIIQGGYIKTALIDAGAIKAKVIDVDELKAKIINIDELKSRILTADTIYTGMFQTSKNGNRVLIDSDNTTGSLRMFTYENLEVINIEFEALWSGTSQSDVHFYAYEGNSIRSACRIMGGTFALYAGSEEVSNEVFSITPRTSAGKMYWYIDPQKIPNTGTYYGEVYLSGGVLRVKT